MSVMNDHNQLPDPAAERDRDDPRSDLQQAVEARKDAVERGEGGPEPESLTAPGLFSGNAGTGGETKDQDDDAQ
jgi:hypothetical protein